MDAHEELKHLREELKRLEEKSLAFSSEISSLKINILRLETYLLNQASIAESTTVIPTPENPSAETQEKITLEEKHSPEIQEVKVNVVSEAHAGQTTTPVAEKIGHPENLAKKPVATTSSTQSWEKFIGENLINKIGILITVIGVAIGAKYAIDKDLIGAGMRIALGYLAGGLLAGFGLLLKKKYHDFSAVLISGSAAVFYFMTYIAYSFYGFFSIPVTFGVMVLITASTVYAAIHYQRVIIAHLGLVGAYAIPFLVNNNSGKMEIFFTYITFINIGILAVSLKKYWKSLYYVSFGVTWFIYLVWYLISYKDSLHFGLALLFSSATYLIFYLVTIGYKLLHAKPFGAMDIIMLLGNSMLFYLLGIGVLSNHPKGNDYYAAFTLLNAALHGLIALIFHLRKGSDKHVFYLSVGLAIVFATIAVPVQFDGGVVTLIWILEGCLLAFIGIQHQKALYEKLSYGLLLLAFLNLSLKWISNMSLFDLENDAFQNMDFFSGVVSIIVLLIVYYLQTIRTAKNPFSDDFFNYLSRNFVPVLLFCTGFFTVFTEIEYYWNCYVKAQHEIALNKDYFVSDTAISSYSVVSKMSFVILYISGITWLKRKQTPGAEVSVLLFSALSLTLLLSLTVGLLAISDLQKLYITQKGAAHYYRGSGLLAIRYAFIACLGFLLWNLHAFIKSLQTWKSMQTVTSLILHMSLLWLLSSEWIYWMNFNNSRRSYKLGLSILWGLYALYLVVLGIKMKRAHLRIAAFSLFGFILVKLFLYDIAHLNTLAKTIVFISLGVLLLIISFLYVKFKDRIE
jgi:uncharacterized membrane protein